jgi:uncharacterized metal-binding protein YceD (DUF177 family)
MRGYHWFRYAMSDAAPEFSRIVPLNRLGGDPFRQQIAASEEERTALARRFDLLSLDRLAAEVELMREPGRTILLSATFEAEFAQECIVTFEPVAGAISERFQLRYGPPEAETDAPAGDADPAFEPLYQDAIDIGEAVAQEFSLALPPFPRTPDAVVDIDAEIGEEDGPFAALARLPRSERQ